jgi:hypothetical protein
MIFQDALPEGGARHRRSMLIDKPRQSKPNFASLILFRG